MPWGCSFSLKSVTEPRCVVTLSVRSRHLAREASAGGRLGFRYGLYFLLPGRFRVSSLIPGPADHSLEKTGRAGVLAQGWGRPRRLGLGTGTDLPRSCWFPGLGRGGEGIPGCILRPDCHSGLGKSLSPSWTRCRGGGLQATGSNPGFLCVAGLRRRRWHTPSRLDSQAAEWKHMWHFTALTAPPWKALEEY